MTRNALVKSLSAWAGTALAAGGEHCFERRLRFRLPGAGPVDLLTVRHTPTAPGTQPQSFAVGLWTIEDRPIRDSDVDAMTRKIHAFQAWYLELLEHAETQGFGPLHRISVIGNLVGRSIRKSPLIDLLSNWGSALCFWTWTPAGAGLDVAPGYAPAPALAAARAQLKGLLPHLTWQDTGERQEESDARIRRRTARHSTPG